MKKIFLGMGVAVAMVTQPTLAIKFHYLNLSGDDNVCIFAEYINSKDYENTCIKVPDGKMVVRDDLPFNGVRRYTVRRGPEVTVASKETFVTGKDAISAHDYLLVLPQGTLYYSGLYTGAFGDLNPKLWFSRGFFDQDIAKDTTAAARIENDKWINPEE